MKRAFRKITALLTTLCLVAGLTACGRPAEAKTEQLPVLTVHITMDLERTATFRTLRDPAFSRQVEEGLGLRLDVRTLPADMDYNEVALLDVSGILLTDDPAWVVPLAESRKIVSMGAPEQGGYGL